MLHNLLSSQILHDEPGLFMLCLLLLSLRLQRTMAFLYPLTIAPNFRRISRSLALLVRGIRHLVLDLKHTLSVIAEKKRKLRVYNDA